MSEVFRCCTQEVDEVLRDISTVDESSIGIEASVTEFPDGSYLLLIVEDVMHVELIFGGTVSGSC